MTIRPPPIAASSLAGVADMVTSGDRPCYRLADRWFNLLSSGVGPVLRRGWRLGLATTPSGTLSRSRSTSSTALPPSAGNSATTSWYGRPRVDRCRCAVRRRVAAYRCSRGSLPDSLRDTSAIGSPSERLPICAPLRVSARVLPGQKALPWEPAHTCQQVGSLSAGRSRQQQIQ